MDVPTIVTLSRDWRLTWSAMRSGGLLLLADYDEDAAAEKVRALSGGAVTSFNGAVVEELREFFRKASLEPGRYAVPNYYAPQAPNGRILLDSTSDGRNTIAVPDAPEIAVAFTREHRALIRAANVSTWESLVAPIDPFAPYGNGAHYDVRVHGEMLFAVHAFLCYARV